MRPFTTQEKAELRALVAAGDLVAAQRLILSALA